MQTNSTMLNSVTSWMRRIGWWCSSADCFAEFVLSHSRYFCSEGLILLRKRCLSLTGKKELVVLFSPFVDLSIAFSLPGALVSAMEVVPVCSRQHYVNKEGSYFFLFAVASHCGRYWYVQCDSSIEPRRPTWRGKLRLPVNLRILKSVSDWRKSSVTLCCTPQCVTSLLVMHLPQVRTAFTSSCGNRRCTGEWWFEDFEGFSGGSRPDRAWSAYRICKEVFLQKRSVSMMGIELMISSTQWAPHYPLRQCEQHLLLRQVFSNTNFPFQWDEYQRPLQKWFARVSWMLVPLPWRISCRLEVLPGFPWSHAVSKCLERRCRK